MKCFFRLLTLSISFLTLSADLGSTTNALPANWSPSTPSGFQVIRPLEHFGTPKLPQKNGTVYDYMNGGGEVFIQHGLTGLRHAVWNKGEKIQITLDIFTFVSSDQAERAKNDDDICPPGYAVLNLGDTLASSYAFSPEYFLYFCSGSHLIYLYVSDDSENQTLKQYATKLLKEINTTGGGL